MIDVEKATKLGLEIYPVFTQWQMHCSKCSAIFCVDTEPESTGEEILQLEDITVVCILSKALLLN